jgi:hypothetical protein
MGKKENPGLPETASISLSHLTKLFPSLSIAVTTLRIFMGLHGLPVSSGADYF